MPCDYSKYPKDWKDIRARILERDGRRCKWCGVRQYGLGRWVDDRFHYVGGTIYYDDFQYTGSYEEAAEARDYNNEWLEPGESKYIVIVLTVAHVQNPDPMDCRDENLAALCQRCHLRHDAKHHAANARETRNRKKGQLDLLEVTG